MTQQFTAPQPFAPAPQKKKQWFKKPIVWLPVATLILGSMMGSAGQPDPEIVEKQVPGPERIVEKPVEKRVEVKVPTTPASCITALDLSQQGFTYSAEAMGYMNDAVQAAGRFNVAGLEAANAKLEILNPKLTALAPQMQAATAECRAAAK